VSRGEGSSTPRVARSRMPLIWIGIVTLAPFVASLLLYYGFEPEGRINYGTLLGAQRIVVPDAALVRFDGTPLPSARGRWTLLVVGEPTCPTGCQQSLYATRQVRTMQGKERERVVRLWLATGDAPPTAELALAHPDLLIARADPRLLAALPDPRPERAIWLVDPLGNLVLRWPPNPDIKRMHKDLSRLLYASQIG
jgi:hypothetical protein